MAGSVSLLKQTSFFKHPLTKNSIEKSADSLAEFINREPGMPPASNP